MVYSIVLQKQQVLITTGCKNNITAKRIDPEQAPEQDPEQRQKEDKSLPGHIHTLMRVNVVFYIIFIIAICRIDIKLAKKPCFKGFQP